tara:strand:+ start:319 stop:753 length:435 start_codon:yes stop_codon:yes gene_type:complete
MATDGLWDVVTEAEVPGLFRAARHRGVKRAKTIAKFELRKKKRREAIEAGLPPPSIIKEVPENVEEPRVDFAKMLAKEALKRGSRDNISVVVVFASNTLQSLDELMKDVQELAVEEEAKKQKAKEEKEKEREKESEKEANCQED